MPRPPVAFSAPPADRRMVRWLALPLGLAGWAYLRVLDGELVLDDLATLGGTPAARDLGAALTGAWPSLRDGRDPLTALSFALDHAWAGLHPRAYHLTALGLHLAVASLAYLLARLVLRLGGAARPTGLAVAVAGLFALHPLQSEAVAHLARRADLLGAGLYLATLLLLVSAERHGPSRRGGLALLLALSAFLLGLTTGPLLFTLPVTWLLLAWAVPTEAARRILASWPRRLLVLVPFLALEGAYLALTPWRVEAVAQPPALAVPAAPALPPLDWLLTQGRVLLTYLRLLLWPAGQSARWDFAPSHRLAEPGVITAGLALLSILAATVALWRWARDRRPADYDGAAGRVAGFGVAWFFVVAITASAAPGGAPLSEPRVYLASLGLLLAVGAGAERLLSRPWPVGPARRRAAVLLVTAAFGVLAMALHRRNRVWESAQALWADVVLRSPEDAGARLGLGDALRAAGDAEGAADQYHRGLLLLEFEAARGLEVGSPLERALEERLGAGPRRPDRDPASPPGR